MFKNFAGHYTWRARIIAGRQISAPPPIVPITSYSAIMLRGRNLSLPEAKIVTPMLLENCSFNEGLGAIHRLRLDYIFPNHINYKRHLERTLFPDEIKTSSSLKLRTFRGIFSAVAHHNEDNNPDINKIIDNYGYNILYYPIDNPSYQLLRYDDDFVFDKVKFSGYTLIRRAHIFPAFWGLESEGTCFPNQPLRIILFPSPPGKEKMSVMSYHNPVTADNIPSIYILIGCTWNELINLFKYFVKVYDKFQQQASSLQEQTNKNFDKNKFKKDLFSYFNESINNVDVFKKILKTFLIVWPANSRPIVYNGLSVLHHIPFNEEELLLMVNDNVCKAFPDVFVSEEGGHLVKKEKFYEAISVLINALSADDYYVLSSNPVYAERKFLFEAPDDSWILPYNTKTIIEIYSYDNRLAIYNTQTGSWWYIPKSDETPLNVATRLVSTFLKEDPRFIAYFNSINESNVDTTEHLSASMFFDFAIYKLKEKILQDPSLIMPRIDQDSHITIGGIGQTVAFNVTPITFAMKEPFISAAIQSMKQNESSQNQGGSNQTQSQGENNQSQEEIPTQTYEVCIKLPAISYHPDYHAIMWGSLRVTDFAALCAPFAFQINNFLYSSGKTIYGVDFFDGTTLSHGIPCCTLQIVKQADVNEEDPAPYGTYNFIIDKILGAKVEPYHKDKNINKSEHSRYRKAWFKIVFAPNGPNIYGWSGFYTTPFFRECVNWIAPLFVMGPTEHDKIFDVSRYVDSVGYNCNFSPSSSFVSATVNVVLIVPHKSVSFIEETPNSEEVVDQNEFFELSHKSFCFELLYKPVVPGARWRRYFFGYSIGLNIFYNTSGMEITFVAHDFTEILKEVFIINRIILDGMNPMAAAKLLVMAAGFPASFITTYRIPDAIYSTVLPDGRNFLSPYIAIQHDDVLSALNKILKTTPFVLRASRDGNLFLDIWPGTTFGKGFYALKTYPFWTPTNLLTPGEGALYKDVEVIPNSGQREYVFYFQPSESPTHWQAVLEFRLNRASGSWKSGVTIATPSMTHGGYHFHTHSEFDLVTDPTHDYFLGYHSMFYQSLPMFTTPERLRELVSLYASFMHRPLYTAYVGILFNPTIDIGDIIRVGDNNYRVIRVNLTITTQQRTPVMRLELIHVGEIEPITNQ